MYFVGCAVHAKFGDGGGCAAGEADVRVGTEENIAHGPGEGVGEAAGFTSLPFGDATVFDGFDKCAASGPVDEGDLPAAAYQKQAARAWAFLGEDGGVGGADLGASGEHGELGRCSEGGGQLHEVPSAEVLLGFGADKQHAAVAVEEAAFDEVGQERGSGAVKRSKAVPLFGPQAIAKAVFLQGNGEELLCNEVAGRGGR